MSKTIILLLATLFAISGSAWGQCNGDPFILTGLNSTGHLAFPEGNWNSHSMEWQPLQYYPTSVTCTWIIKAPPSHLLVAAFRVFDTEVDYDLVTIYDGEDRSEQLLKLSGDLQADSFVVSPSGTLVVDFYSDEYTTYTGFLLVYKYEPRACMEGGITVTEDHLIALPPSNLQGVLPGPRIQAVDKGGQIRLDNSGPFSLGPDYSKMTWQHIIQYDAWVNCTWRVAVDTRNIINIEILNFNTNHDDLLTVWQLNDGGYSPIFSYAGSDPPPAQPLQSTKPLVITFVSGSSDPGTGFLIDVSYIKRACEPSYQELTAPRGIIAYPHYNSIEGGFLRSQGKINYGPDDCEWVISAPEGYTVNLTIMHFDTRQQDELQIQDGSQPSLSYGGSLAPSTIFISKESKLALKFQPKEDTQNTGFLIHYSWLLKDCSSELDDDHGEIQSPYYPDTYGANITCRWTINSKPGYLVHILVARLRLDDGDLIEVTDGNQDILIAGFPVNTGRLLHLLPSPKVDITFKSDLQKNRGYFLLKYASFRTGSCDFSLSPCGWISIDPLQSWSFRGSEGLMAVAEESGLGLKLPRGYRSVLASPWITPLTSLSSGSKVPTAMCIKLDYLLDGPDAFLLTVSMKQERPQVFSRSFSPQEETLLSLYGPHGNKSLSSAINIKVTEPFQILLQYERGYGPHYNVQIRGVNITEGECGEDLDAMKSFSCAFSEDYCGWRNTHMDQKNWLLSDQGIVAEVRSGSVSGRKSVKKTINNHEQQWADLVSPIIVKDELLFDLRDTEQKEQDSCEKGQSTVISANASCVDDNTLNSGTDPVINIVSTSINGTEGACLKLHYHLLSEHTELQILLKDVDKAASKDADQKSRGIGQKDDEEVILWSQGRVKSPGVMEAFINILPTLLPKRYQIVLRAVGVNEVPEGSVGMGGVKVHRIELHPNHCNTGPSCDFDKGFCSWSVSSTGKTVWYIAPHKDEDEIGSHAALLVEGGPEDSSSMTSDIISTPHIIALTLRYKLMTTTGCLSVTQRGLKGGHYSSGTSINVWEQCRGKGDHWLHECVELPKQTYPYQVVIVAGSGETSTNMWLDDLQLSTGGCDITHPPITPLPSLATPPQWKCELDGTLCGMTQPKFGHRDWIFVHRVKPEEALNSTIAEPVFKNLPPNKVPVRASDKRSAFPTGDPEFSNNFVCQDGTALEAEWVCDGIPDCPDHWDEQGCECDSEPDSFDSECGKSPHSSLHLGAGVCAEGAFMCPPPSEENCPNGDCASFKNPCLPRHSVCDGIQDCPGNEDEMSCQGVNRSPPAHETMGSGTMLCSGGLRIPTAWRCDGRKDCPLDGLDEVGCQYCGMEEFICPTTGICVPQQQVCDDAPSIPTCTDETFCYDCPPAHFVCDVCVASWQICDGVWDCEGGEDERYCTGLGTEKGCEEDHYRCPGTGHCLPTSSICDRRFDCADGNDERKCPDDNFEIEKYISVKPSPVGGSQFASRLVTPILTHPAGGVGVLTFKYRLDTWLGPSNATISIEMVDEDDMNVGLRRWALWRQSGHKGRQWLSSSILVPPHLRDSYRIAFILSRDEHGHDSQQFHLAHLTYRVVLPAALNDLGSRLLHCDFKDTLCGWSQPSPVGGYSWVYAQASPHTRRTGPITGYLDGGKTGFIFADSLYGSEGSTADLLSPPLIMPFGQNNPVLCFRFAVFLFGADVAKVSVHVLQRVGDAVHTAELFHAVGGMGLSWIPVSVNIGVEELADPRLPLVLVIRATRGAGPEGDIALDHLSIFSGSCQEENKLIVDPNITLSAIYHPDAHAISAGPSITPMPTFEQGQEGSTYELEDECGRRTTCTSCVGDDVELDACTWCDLNQRCLSSLSPAASACPHYLSVHHNTSEQQTRRGPVWCPQLLPQELPYLQTAVMVAAGSSPILSFPVSNIQSTHTDRGWTCLFEPIDEEIKDSASDLDAVEEGQKEILKSEETIKEAIEKRLNLDEQEQLKKKKLAGLKKLKAGSKDGSMKLSGQFQGRLYDVGEGVGTGVGVGNIRCGDGTTQLRSNLNNPQAYDVHLLTPAAAILDNPSHVRLVIYDCMTMGLACDACVALNTSYGCGWCELTETCTTHAHCTGHSWIASGDTCYSADHPKKLLKGTVNEETDDDEEAALLALGEHLGKHMSIPLGAHVQSIAFDQEVEVYPMTTRDEIEYEGMEALTSDPLEEEMEEMEESEEVDIIGGKKNKKNGRKNNRRKKGRKNRGKGLAESEETNMVNDSQDTGISRLGGSIRSGGGGTIKGEVRIRGRGRSFLRLPQQPGLFIARDSWRLHTGRQYYVPVTKKTLINLGFVRQVIYGNLAEEKSRTVLINGAWKKAAGYYIDLFEKVDHSPVTSVITTSRRVFEQLLVQLTPTADVTE